MSFFFFPYENGSLKKNRKMYSKYIGCEENDDHNCFLTHQRVRKELKRCRKFNVKVMVKYYIHLFGKIFNLKYIIKVSCIFSKRINIWKN